MNYWKYHLYTEPSTRGMAQHREAVPRWHRSNVLWIERNFFALVFSRYQAQGTVWNSSGLPGFACALGRANAWRNPLMCWSSDNFQSPCCRPISRDGGPCLLLPVQRFLSNALQQFLNSLSGSFPFAAFQSESKRGNYFNLLHMLKKDRIMKEIMNWPFSLVSRAIHKIRFGKEYRSPQRQTIWTDFLAEHMWLIQKLT
jgi:hypothetical protein